MVKTRVISLLGEEGRNERDQIAFCSFNSFLLLSPPQSPLCIAGRAGEREKESARGRPPRFLFFDFIGMPSGSLCGGESSQRKSKRMLATYMRRMRIKKQPGD